MVQAPPLTGIRVLEFAGLAPGPFAGLLLADAGASVLRIDRPVSQATTSSHSPIPPRPTADLLTRHKTSIAVDLKSASGRALVERLAAAVDILIDPFRPGVLERLGLGPAELCRCNPRLIFARITGFRRDGRYRDMAGHDINYLAVSGVLSLLGREGQRPHAPGNLLGDFAGGGAALFQGILLALVARQASGRGQVVESNMVDGAAYVATYARLARGTAQWRGARGTNLLDGGCPYYDTYATADGRFVAVGALEPQFFDALMRGLGLSASTQRQLAATRGDPRCWAEMRRMLEECFRRKTRGEWEAVFDGTDACVTPVLDLDELEVQRGDGRREGDQRPWVTLRETPTWAVAAATGAPDARDPSEGQGRGVDGDGWTARGLSPGEGGEQTLNRWFGWERGHDYEVRNGGLTLPDKTSKL